MKQINYEDLGVLFGTTANEYFNTDMFGMITTTMPKILEKITIMKKQG